MIPWRDFCLEKIERQTDRHILTHPFSIINVYLKMNTSTKTNIIRDTRTDIDASFNNFTETVRHTKMRI